MIVEINTHTGEKRLHTLKTVVARLRAMRVPVPSSLNLMLANPNWRLETPHSDFRAYQTSLDFGKPIQQAMENGAWGYDL